MFGQRQAAGSLFPEISWLQQQLEDMLQPGSVAGIRSLARGAFPAINIGNSVDGVEVIAFVPGIDPKEIEITIERGLLTLAGERTVETSQGQAGSNSYAKERFAGKFRRVVSLPDDADPAKVEAKVVDGILRVSIAKRESSKPRQITVS